MRMVQSSESVAKANFVYKTRHYTVLVNQGRQRNQPDSLPGKLGQDTGQNTNGITPGMTDSNGMSFSLRDFYQPLPFLFYSSEGVIVIQKDITLISDDEILDSYSARKPDIVLGGPPCQGYSVCTQRAGVK